MNFKRIVVCCYALLSISGCKSTTDNSKVELTTKLLRDFESVELPSIKVIVEGGSIQMSSTELDKFIVHQKDKSVLRKLNILTRKAHNKDPIFTSSDGPITLHRYVQNKLLTSCGIDDIEYWSAKERDAVLSKALEE